MPSARTILRNLKNHQHYMASFTSHQSFHFENLIAEALSHILHLEFYDRNSDNPNNKYRVTWNGCIHPLDKAPCNEPDATARCCNYHLIIEATTSTGAIQWGREFTQAIRHCENYCNQPGVNLQDTYILLICTEIHRDTFRAAKGNPNSEYRLIPLEVTSLQSILETSILAFTAVHEEVKKLLGGIIKTMNRTNSVEEFRIKICDLLIEWQKDVMEDEKEVFAAVKSYAIMRDLNRINVSPQEILTKLRRNPVVNHYFNIIGSRLTPTIIEKSLVNQGLAIRLTSTYNSEDLYAPVPWIDFLKRYGRLLKEVKKTT